ncbi:MAG: hypothetical protein H6767_07240 [Candidatus Peribacteria bacterium]|nr:MAG: hypothetical protein H6767_07240 [Candidatus Peribacteria bacterium]
MKILGKPIVEYSLESIYEHVDEIIIIVQYLQEQIRNYFGNAYHGTPITYHEQGSLPGTG